MSNAEKAESNARPLTMSAERLQQIRERWIPNGPQVLIDLMAELDARELAHAETRERLNEAQRGHTRAAMDVAVLLSELRAHEENTGESLEDEDAAVVAEIESRYTAALRAKQEPPPAPSRPAESPSSDTSGLQGRKP